MTRVEATGEKIGEETGEEWRENDIDRKGDWIGIERDRGDMIN